MEPQTDKPKNKIPEKKSLVDSPLFDFGSVGITIASGLLGAWHAIQRNFSNRIMNATGLLRDLRSTRDKQLHKLDAAVPDEAFIKEHQKIWHEYEEAKDALLIKKRIKSPWGKWQMLDRHGRGEAIITASAAMAVAIGAVLTFSGLRRLGNKQKELQEQLDAKDQENTPQR